MGHRTVKRVPLDFDHPLDKVWPGYIRQSREFPPCPDCRYGRNETMTDRFFSSSGDDRPTGLSPEAYAIDNTFYPHQIGGPLAEVLAWHDKLGQAEVDMLAEQGRVGNCWDIVDLPEPHEISEEGWPIRFKRVRNSNPPPPAGEVNAAQRGRRAFGHDSINRMYLVEFRCKQLGITMECPTCKGRCVIATDEEYEAEKAAEEAWEPTEPPLGVGWQLWETVSEGSPQSPVFGSAGELADWCAVNASPFADLRWTREQWFRFISDDDVDNASLMVVAGGPPTTLGALRDTKGLVEVAEPEPVKLPTREGLDRAIAELEALAEYDERERERDREYRDHWRPIIVRMLGEGKSGPGEPLTDVPRWAKDRYRDEKDF